MRQGPYEAELCTVHISLPLVHFLLRDTSEDISSCLPDYVPRCAINASLDIILLRSEISCESTHGNVRLQFASELHFRIRWTVMTRARGERCREISLRAALFSHYWMKYETPKIVPQ